MIGSFTTTSWYPRPGPIRATRPAVEGLEDRVLLYSTTGGQWTYPVEITYSIIPDGTSIGGIPSNLQQVLSSQVGMAAADPEGGGRVGGRRRHQPRAGRR